MGGKERRWRSGVVFAGEWGYTENSTYKIMSQPSLTDLPSLHALKDDAMALGEEAAELARERILRPVQERVRESREQLGEAGQGLKEGAEKAEEVLLAEGERAALWIKEHPWAAVGLAFGAGVVLSELWRTRR